MTRLTIAIGVLLVIFLGGWGYEASSTPTFCRSCHEMGYYYNTWSSSSHHEINCEECHLGPNLKSMIITKIGALKEILIHQARKPEEAQVPRAAQIADAVCRKCHQPPQGELHYHLLRITHQDHLDRGMHCLDCHSNVVHGGRTGFKNTPPMQGCLKCHDGEQAPNNCGECHLKLGEISPAVYNPAWVASHKANLADTGRDKCNICHGEKFCKSCHETVPPHSSNWQLEHQKTPRSDLPKCATCHQPRQGEDMALFCIDCHKARGAHNPQYILTHPQDYQKRPQTCGLCHDSNFCTSCHQIYRPHPLDWLSKHGPQSRTGTPKCATCHNQKFCQDCHTNGKPQSHGADWRTKHGQVAATGQQNCSACHPSQMCQQCHANNPPRSHANRPVWLKAHGPQAAAGVTFCYTCHDRQSCTQCHNGLQMPHAANWKQVHGKTQAAQSRQACKMCHQPEFCNTCHRGTKPSSHNTDWINRHGPTSLQRGAECKLCHSGGNFCTACHALPMPHPNDWTKSHGKVAQSQPAKCQACHQAQDCLRCHAKQPPDSHRRSSFDTQHASQGVDPGLCTLCHGGNACIKCHEGVAMPHDDAFKTGGHGAIAQRNPQACAKCHHDPKLCLSCHSGMPPDSHGKKTWKSSVHTQAPSSKLCSLCHGANACSTCHSKLKKSPHADDWAMTHKTQASFQKNAKCFLCHKIDYCRQCHENAALK